jgi:hypothetical protein
MKHIVNPLKYLAVVGLLAVAVGCASEQSNKESLAIAAGFKVITPRSAEQTNLLQSLPAGQVTRINYNGHTLFVLPDAKNNVAYVGRENEYQAYQQLRLAQNLSNQNLEAAQMNQMATMNYGWNRWGGWGGWGWGWR